MDQKLFKKLAGNKPVIWISAGMLSVALLALVMLQTDMAQLQGMVGRISWPLLAVAVLFLFLEGIATALRLWLFAGRKACLGEALKANAWYVLLLVILPARLGEVAAIVVLEKYLGQKYGAAAMSIIVQRLYDVLVLGTFFLIALLGLGDFIDIKFMSIAAVILIGGALFILLRLNMFLTLAALLLGGKKRRAGMAGKLKRLLLQARIYSRHILKARDIPLALLLSMGKWISNLAGLVFLFMTIHLGLGFFENITVAAAYNFLAVVPLQTIGGIGIGEAGLALLLGAAGLSASIAASASLLIRFVIVLFPFIFWASVMGGLKMKEKAQL